MNRTRELLATLILLITLMGLYYVLTNYKETSKFIIKVVKKITQKEIQVPDYVVNHRTYTYDTVNETDDFKPKNIEDIKKIYYTVLNNGWTSFTFYCDLEYETCPEDVKKIADANNDSYITLINNYVSPYNSYKTYNTLIVNDDEVNLTIEKLYSEEEIEKLDRIITKYLTDNNITSTNYTYKDIEKIHDYILKNVTYDNDYVKTNVITDSNKATGALFNGIALCSGYSDTFALFLDKLNIPNFKINSEEHEWNAIYLDNKWSHIDVTWDDDEINKNNNRNFYMVTTSELLEKDSKQHNFTQELYKEIK